MAHPVYHAVSSVNTWGGKVEDYLPVHQWFDATKQSFPDQRHRSLRHHAEGIFWCEEKFGAYIVNADGKMVPIRLIGEQHVREDLGYIPTIQQWLECMSVKAWMLKPGEGRKVLHKIHTEKQDHVPMTTYDRHGTNP